MPRAFWIRFCAVAFCAAFAAASFAADHREITLPMGTAGPGPSGLIITVRQVFDANPGVRPVVVQVQSPTATSPVDREIEVRFSTNRSAVGCWTTTVAFVLPAGKPTAQATFQLPLPRPSIDLGWEVWIDGYAAPELSRTAPWNGPNRSNQLHILLIDSKAPPPMNRLQTGLIGGQRPKWSPAYPLPNGMPTVIAQYPIDQHPSFLSNRARTDAGFEYLPPGELGESWVAFDRYDIVCMSDTEFQWLRQHQPKRWEAIRRWAMGGGTLYIMPPESFTLEFDRLPVDDFYYVPSEIHAVERAMIPDAPQVRGSTDAKILSMGLGRYLAVKPVGTDVASRVVHSPEMISHQWMLRHYYDPQRGAPGQQVNFLIDGIGKPPIALFFILLTMFVIGVGPLAYFLLARMGRIPLLLVIVPTVSLVITVGLILVALFGDGLGTRARVRSITYLNPQGEFASWSRQTYFCGLAPASGLIYPRDAAVYPIDITPRALPDREVVLEEQTQQLARGYLASREFAQLLVGHTGDTKRGLKVLPPAGPSRPLQVQNNLGTAILQLKVVDADGAVWFGAKIEPGAIADLRPLSEQTVKSQFVPWRQDMRIFTSPSLDPNYLSQSGQGIIESNTLREIASRRPRSFAAMTAGSVEVPMGISGASEEDSYHFICGDW